MKYLYYIVVLLRNNQNDNNRSFISIQNYINTEHVRYLYILRRRTGMQLQQ